MRLFECPLFRMPFQHENGCTIEGAREPKWKSPGWGAVCMRSIFGVLPCMIAAAFSAGAADGPPGWAYGFPPNPAPAANPAGVPGGGGGRGGRGPQAPPDTSVKHLDGSKLEFTRTQINDGFGPADWFPEDHPQMLDIVAHGRRPDVRACALCHYPNGKGRAENAGVSGLSVAYFIQQMNDFKDGNRKSAEPRKSNTNAMASLAKAMTDEEIKAAAEYFGSIQFTPWIKVVEATMGPRRSEERRVGKEGRSRWSP